MGLLIKRAKIGVDNESDEWRWRIRASIWSVEKGSEELGWRT